MVVAYSTHLLAVCHRCVFIFLQHDTTRSFFMTVEAPDTIRRGEQIGLRLDIFNNWDQDMEVCVEKISSTKNVLCNK